MNTGNHSYQELIELTKGLFFLRYFPRSSGFEFGDKLQLSLRSIETSDLEEKSKTLENYFCNLYPALLIEFQCLEKEGKINISLSKGEEPGDLEPHHFEIARTFETDLLTKVKELSLTPAFHENLEENGFTGAN